MLNLGKLAADVFGYKDGEKILIIHDLPAEGKDTALWKKRREMAADWSRKLKSQLATYGATYANNSDLPNVCLIGDKKTTFDEIFSKAGIVILLNEFSATAPMHRYADKYGLRVASMPGFSDLMIPALEIDYNDVAKKVDRLHSFFSRSEFADIVFSVGKKDYTLHIDFRKRTPLKDDGNCREKGTVINLPSGEAFTSPYDEIDSETNGYFPIEQAGEVVVYKVKKNRITGANKDTALLKKIRQEAAVGNIAEMAFGVLSLYGIKPCGRVLLDEKLGMHIALGRDDHFGGSTGPDSFREKENIWHQDYVYIKEMQPHIAVKEAKLGDSIIIKDSRYIIF